MKLISLLCVLFSMSIFAQTPQDAPTSDIYELGSNRTKLIYRGSFQKTINGGQIIHDNSYKSLDGKELAHETTVEENGLLKKFSFNNPVTKQSGFVEARDGTLYFHYSIDGKVTTGEEKIKGTYACGPLTTAFIRSNWKKIIAGEEINLRYPVIDRQETVGFKFFKDREDKFNGRDVVVVKMKPSSFIIAALVDPLYFFFDKENLNLVNLIGRIPIKKLNGSKIIDIDGETVYNYN